MVCIFLLNPVIMYVLAVLVDPQCGKSYQGQCPLFSENKACETFQHIHVLLLWQELVCLSMRSHSLIERELASLYLANHPFSIYTRQKAELWLLFKIIKGVALPLCPVWALDVETRKMKRKFVGGFLPSKCSAMSMFWVHHNSSPSTTKVAGQTTHPNLRPGSVIFEPLLIQSLVWMKAPTALGGSSIGIVY